MNLNADQLSKILEARAKVGSKYHCIHKSVIKHNTINLGLLFVILASICGVCVAMPQAPGGLQ